MTIDRESSLVDVAFEVCTALDRAGVVCVLTGGAAAVVHAPDALQSYDLDFVLDVHASATLSEEALLELGYRRRSTHYQHALSRFAVEFPRGPLMVGDDRVTSFDLLRRDDLLLRVLTPTDSVRDRLAAFLFWNDRSALEQALQVAKARRTRIDLDVVREWCERMGALDRFREFETRHRGGGPAGAEP